MAASSNDADEGEVLDAVPVSIFDEWLKRAPVSPVAPAPAQRPALTVKQAMVFGFLLGAVLFSRAYSDNSE